MEQRQTRSRVKLKTNEDPKNNEAEASVSKTTDDELGENSSTCVTDLVTPTTHCGTSKEGELKGTTPPDISSRENEPNVTARSDITSKESEPKRTAPSDETSKEDEAKGIAPSDVTSKESEPKEMDTNEAQDTRLEKNEVDSSPFQRLKMQKKNDHSLSPSPDSSPVVCPNPLQNVV